MIELCTPAIIFVIFSLIQIIIDIYKGLFNTAFIKTIVMIIITFLLNMLCEGGMSIISWIIVFIPFIFMTVIITLLLYAFGLNTTTGTFQKYPNNITIDEDNNIIVYDPYDNYILHPAYYENESIFIPNPNALNETTQSTTVTDISNNYFPSNSSSDPSYQS